MNILLINHYAGSDEMGMEFRPYYLAREVGSLGHRMTILAGSYSHLRRVNPNVTEADERQQHHGVDYHFIRTAAYDGNGVSRIISMMQFVSRGRSLTRKLVDLYSPDAVVCSSTYPLDTYIGQRIARISGARLYHEVHDLWPLSPKIIGGYSDDHPFIRIMQRGEDSAYRNSEKIISILPNIEPYVRSRGFDTPVIHIPNGVLDEDLQTPGTADPAVTARIDRLKSEGRTVIGFAGGLVPSGAMEPFVRQMVELAHTPYTAVIIGDGVEKDLLISIVSASGADNVIFCDPIPKPSVVPTLAHVDITYTGMRPSPLYEYGIAQNKAIDYLRVGKPIVEATGSAHSPYVYADNAWNVEIEEPGTLLPVLESISRLTAQERSALAERSLEYVETNHTYSRIARKFIETVSD